MEQWKMKIAYNSAHVQIETFNFTFAQQAIISAALSISIASKALLVLTMSSSPSVGLQM